MNEIVGFNQVTRFYGDVKAVDRLVFNLEKGSVTALIGLNGAGKTTTMEILMGHLDADGQVSLWGENSRKLSPGINPGRVYYVPENKVLPCDIVMKDMVMSVCEKHRSGLNVDYELLMSYLQATELDRFLEKKLNALSLGQKAALYILIGLSTNAELLVLDEPLSGLDPYIRSLIIDELKSNRWQDRSIFYSSHILEEVERVADNVIILHKGRILYHGSIDLLKESYSEVLLEATEYRDNYQELPGVLYVKKQKGNVVGLFIEEKSMKDSLPGKKYGLNLKEIFLYLIERENKRMEDNK